MDTNIDTIKEAIEVFETTAPEAWTTIVDGYRADLLGTMMASAWLTVMGMILNLILAMVLRHFWSLYKEGKAKDGDVGIAVAALFVACAVSGPMTMIWSQDSIESWARLQYVEGYAAKQAMERALAGSKSED